MLLRLLYLLLFLALYAGNAFAQVYEPGFLVRANGDTLRGELENDFWVEAPPFVRFRREAGRPGEVFPARQLQTISFTGGRYFRHEILLLDHAAETRQERLERGNFVNMQPDTMLAEVLLTGPVELLRVVRPSVTHYVMRRPGRPDLALSERKYLQDSGIGTLIVIDGNNYRNQLTVYFLDCPAAVRAVQGAPFTADGLAAVAQAYATTCTPAGQSARSWLAPATSRHRLALQGGLLAGVRYHRLASTFPALASQCTDCQPHPFGGLYAELLQPGRKAALYGELSMTGFHNQVIMDLGYDVVTKQQVYSYLSYRALLATARLGMRFFSPLPHDQQLLMGFAFEYNQVLGPTIPTNSRAYYISPSTRNTAYPAPALLPSLMLGWRRQRFTLSLDGQFYNNANASTNMSASFDSFSTLFFGNSFGTRLGVSYRLGRHPDTTTPRLGR